MSTLADKLKKAAMDVNIEKGDILLGGRFKNQREVVKEIGIDELGQPTVNGKKLLSFRIEKDLPKDKQSRKTRDMNKEAVWPFSSDKDTTGWLAERATLVNRADKGDKEAIAELDRLDWETGAPSYDKGGKTSHDGLYNSLLKSVKSDPRFTVEKKAMNIKQKGYLEGYTQKEAVCQRLTEEERNDPSVRSRMDREKELIEEDFAEARKQRDLRLASKEPLHKGAAEDDKPNMWANMTPEQQKYHNELLMERIGLQNDPRNRAANIVAGQSNVPKLDPNEIKDRVDANSVNYQSTENHNQTANRLWGEGFNSAPHMRDDSVMPQFAKQLGTMGPMKSLAGKLKGGIKSMSGPAKPTKLSEKLNTAKGE